MRIISTEKAPKAIGPYSQAVVSNGLVFTSGQIPVDPKTNEVVAGGIEHQAVQVLENLKNVLIAAGSSLDGAVKVTVYLADMDDFSKMNAIYEKYFPGKPARATIQAGRLPKDVKIEIDAVAEIR